MIDTSTIGIKAAEACAALLAKAGIEFVDAPVSGGTSGADKATIAIMLACPQRSLRALQAADEPDGQAVPRRAEAGPGTGRQGAQQLPVRHGAGRDAREAIAFGTALGIDMKTILDIVNASSGRNSATDDKFLSRILHGRYDAGFTAKLQLKDIRLYLEAARAAGITDEVAGPVVDVWQRMDAAMPGADITDMYRYTQKRRRS